MPNELLAAPPSKNPPSILRHILPASSLPLVLKQGQVEWIRWKKLAELLAAGSDSSKNSAQSKNPNASSEKLPFVFSDLEISAQQVAEAGDAKILLKASVKVLKEGFRAIRILDASLTPTHFEARKRGDSRAKAHLLSDSQGYSILIGTPGTWSFELQAWAPITQNGHLSSLSVRFPPVPGAIGKAALLGETLEVFMDPAPETKITRVADGYTYSEAPLPPGAPFQVQWFPKDAGLIPEDLDPQSKVSKGSGLESLGSHKTAHWTQALILGHASMESHVRLIAQVNRAPVSLLKIRLDGAYENLKVAPNASLIESVTPVAGGVDVILAGERQGKIPLDLSYRYRDPEGKPSFSLEVPRLSLENTWSETSYLWIARATNVAITPKLEGSVEPVSAGVGESLPPLPTRLEALLRYRIEDKDARVSLNVQRYPDAAGISTRVIDRVQAYTQLSRRGQAKTTVDLTIRDRVGAPLKILLPKGASPLLFQRNGTRIQPNQEDDGTFNFPLREEGGGLSDSVRVVFSWTASVPSGPFSSVGRAQLELAHLNSSIMELAWQVVAPKGYELLSPKKEAPTGSVRFVRRLVQPQAPKKARTIEVSYRSWQTRETLRVFKLLLGFLAGWILCAVLVGALPLAALAVLLALALVTNYSFQIRGSDPIALGLFASLSFGFWVGIRRAFTLWNHRRKEKKEERQARKLVVETLRNKLREKIGPEPSPLPEDATATSASSGPAAEGDKVKPEAQLKDAKPSGSENPTPSKPPKSPPNKRKGGSR